MSKITIDDLLDETSFLSDVNDRFDQIEDEFQNRVLYRNNPDGEPNAMANDLDMAENDILNVKELDVFNLIVNGIPFNGAVSWGQIGGTLSDQADLEARLVDAKQSGVQDFAIGIQDRTFQAFEVEDIGAGQFVFRYTDAVNAGPYGAVQLNQRGKIGIDLLELTPTDLLGFIRGDDVCPKPIDNAGIPGIPLTPCVGPDYRNPSELLGDIYTNGQAFIIEFEDPEVDGSMNLIDPSNPTGALVPRLLLPGDGVIYLDEFRLPDNTLVIQAGWHKWDQAVVVNTAEATAYNPDGNRIITDPDSTTVDAALTDLDTLCATLAELSVVDAKVAQNALDIATNTANIDINATGITDNASDIVTNTADISTNAGNIATNSADIVNLQNGKVEFTDFPTADGVTAGVVKMRVAGDVLYISTNTTPA